MPDTIERLTAADFDEAMHVMGVAFGFDASRDFPMLLPQIYRPTDAWMRCNYAIRREGKIVSVVGVYPRDWQVGDVTLKLGGIGGVCTLHDYRGQGLMKALMDRCVADMKRDGYHLSWLGGQRQRYQYYGYEKCGPSPGYSLRSTNIRHALGDCPEIRFEPMGAHYADRMEIVKSYHEAKPIHVVRSADDFVLYLLSGYSEPWFALDAEDKVIGYVVTTKDGGHVREIAARDTDTAFDMIHAWSVRIGGDVHVTLMPEEIALARRLGEVAENCQIGISGNWQVFDWAMTLTALLTVQHRCRGLIEGSVVIGIDEETFEMTVDGQHVRCERVDIAPSLTMTWKEAHRVLFGPAPAATVLEIPDAAKLLEAWTPLPLGFLRADSV